MMALIELTATFFEGVLTVNKCALVLFLYITLRLLWDWMWSEITVEPRITYKSTALNDFILSNAHSLHRKFPIARWMTHYHIQTVIPVVFPAVSPVKFRRELMTLEDGGVVALDWSTMDVEKLKPDSLILLLVPTLTGDALMFQNLCNLAAKRGIRAVVFNKRGHGDSPLLTPHLQAFGDISDMKVALEYIKKSYPEAKIIGHSRSAGTGLMGIYQGKLGNESLIEAVAMTSPGWDLEKIFESDIKWPYHQLMVKSLKDIVKRNASILSEKLNLEDVFKVSTLKEFESRVYCKLSGIMNFKQYVDENNPMPTVFDSKRPTLIICSEDDPVVDKSIIPYDIISENHHVILITTSKGGHCGFRSTPKSFSWTEEIVLDFLEAALEAVTKNYEH